MRILPALAERRDGADAVRALREAALKDDDGRALAKAVGGALNVPLAHVA